MSSDSSDNFELANVLDYPGQLSSGQEGAIGGMKEDPTMDTPHPKRPVDIKTATMSDLQTVQGVGPAKAKDIVNLRDHESGLSRSFMNKLSTFKGVDLDGFEFKNPAQLRDDSQWDDRKPVRTDTSVATQDTRRGVPGHQQRQDYGPSNTQREARNLKLNMF